jgi:indolepyruvate ferredoxin oxidoreductase
MTYKILYNDAVAMTGGQPIDGTISVPMIARQMAAEGVQRIAVVTEDLSRYADRSQLPPAVTLHERGDLEAVQRELRACPGVSVLIYDQTCAAEKRRRRKKGEYPQPKQRVFINEAVCEGCGDCGVQSNCTSILPLETEFGRKRAIDQSSCNQDYSCLKGFCPSFVTVEGATPRKSRAAMRAGSEELTPIPEPSLPTLQSAPYNILITGIGGTGVITIGALLGMAGHLEGKGVSALDMTGMSQKNGAVTSHVRIAHQPADIQAQRIATGEADLILGCDMLTAGALDAISKTRPGRTVAVINTHQQPPGPFARDRDWQFPAEQIRALIEESVGGRAYFIDATRLATALLGDSIAANLFMLGFAFQNGLIPLQEASIARAIELNGVSVEANKQAFLWGRRAAIDPDQVQRIALPAKPVVVQMPQSLDALVRRRAAFLTQYQNAAYARRYEEFVEKVRRAELRVSAGDTLAKTVAKSLSKLMAYKDEYEVARLYTNGEFEKRLKEAFEGEFTLKFHLAPPLFARRDAQGRLLKAQFGRWVWHAFKLLARMRFLRGSAFDVFGKTEERRVERRLIADYEASIEAALAVLDANNLPRAIDLAGIPEEIRGFGHVKLESVQKATTRWRALQEAFTESTREGTSPRRAA